MRKKVRKQERIQKIEISSWIEDGRQKNRVTLWFEDGLRYRETYYGYKKLEEMQIGDFVIGSICANGQVFGVCVV